jgi:Ala-tRNA(Pro) deacylase
MGCKEDLEAYLREQGIPFELQHHTVAYTAQEVAASEHVSGRRVAKVVMVVANDQMIMLVLGAQFQVDLSKAATAVGETEVRLAREEEFAPLFPGCEIGAMPPFGNRFGVPVYVDASFGEAERIVCQAGTHTDTVSFRYSEFEQLVKPIVADLHRS